MRRFGRAHRAPFDPGGEGRAATATQARIEHLSRSLFATDSDGSFQTLETAMIQVIVDVQRLCDAGAGKQQALLSLQIGQLFHQTQGQRMSRRLAFQGFEH
ncbi:hypothetical protein D3C76_1315460 [compost metagenome]